MAIAARARADDGPDAPSPKSYAGEARRPPWALRDIRWPMAIYITLTQLLGLAGIAYVPHCKAVTLVWALALWPITAFGITGGAHRLWAHRSYKGTAPYRTVVMLAASIANQGNIFHWVRDHRTHHLHSETVADPHDAGRGMWFAHIGWLYLKKDPRVVEAGKRVNVDDLYDDGPVMFQRALDPWWSVLMCFGFPALVATKMWGESLTNALLVPGCLRYVFVLHATWLVNSAAHRWGARPYDPSARPAENWFVTFAAVGEGWHNWHHKYPFDYAASELGIGAQYNPTKLIIDGAAALGLVSERKRASAMWAREKKARAEAKVKGG